MDSTSNHHWWEVSLFSLFSLPGHCSITKCHFCHFSCVLSLPGSPCHNQEFLRSLSSAQRNYLVETLLCCCLSVPPAGAELGCAWKSLCCYCSPPFPSTCLEFTRQRHFSDSHAVFRSADQLLNEKKKSRKYHLNIIIWTATLFFFLF